MKYQVQRRLPGTQGMNGCWADVLVSDFEDERAAVLAAAEQVDIEGEYRAAPAPQWKSGCVRFRIERKKWPVISASLDFGEDPAIK